MGRQAVAHLGDDVQVRLGIEQCAESDPYHHLVVGQNDAQPVHGRDRSGSRARTTNPCSGSGPAVRTPPTRLARSVIPRMP